MNEQMQTSMQEVMRLTREGRLAEATDLIQSTLGGRSDRTPSPGDCGTETIETTARDADGGGTSGSETPPRTASRTDPGKHDLRRAPRPARSHRSSWHTNWRASEPLHDFLTHDLRFGAGGRVAAGSETPMEGQLIERSYSNRAGSRAYKLYVPSGYTGQETPLVVMLHGCTQSPDDIAAGTRMNALAEEHNFLVAYPEQSAAANNSRCWNWFKASEQRRGQGEPSIIAGITCEILGEYCVDPSRVYVAGMSAGGAMAAILGAGYPDLYAAVGVHSGLAPGAAHDFSSAFGAMRGTHAPPNGYARNRDERTASAHDGAGRVAPAIVFHGDRDSTVHPRNAERLLAHYRAAANAVDGSRGADTTASPTTAHEGRVSGGHAYTRAVHHDSIGNVLVEKWTVHGLGHAWSGGNSNGSYVDPKGPDASAEMLRFFREHSL